MQINARTKDFEVPESFSPELADLIKKLLSKDPEERLSAEETLLHPFF